MVPPQGCIDMSRSMTLAQAAANRISMSLVQEARVNEPVPGPDTNVNDMSMTPPPTSAPTSSRASKQSSITMPQVNEPKLRDPFEVADQFASTITLVIDDLFKSTPLAVPRRSAIIGQVADRLHVRRDLLQQSAHVKGLINEAILHCRFKQEVVFEPVIHREPLDHLSLDGVINSQSVIDASDTERLTTATPSAIKKGTKKTMPPGFYDDDSDTSDDANDSDSNESSEHGMGAD